MTARECFFSIGGRLSIANCVTAPINHHGHFGTLPNNNPRSFEFKFATHTKYSDLEIFQVAEAKVFSQIGKKSMMIICATIIFESITHRIKNN
jgi:hypothetical protein